MCKRILFQQGAYEAQAGQISIVGWNCTSWDTVRYSEGNAVYVELRAVEDDYILQSVVYVDKAVVINKKVCLEGDSEYEHIRKAIAEFDGLYANHPMTWAKAPAVEEI